MKNTPETSQHKNHSEAHLNKNKPLTGCASSVFYEDRRSHKDRRINDDIFALGPNGIERRKGRDQRIIAMIHTF